MSIETQESTDGGQQLLLGKMLLERGVISPNQLREALADRARSMTNGTAKPLGIILVAKGYLTDTQLVQLLAEQTNRPPSSSSGGLAGIPPQLPPAPAAPSATRLGKYELLNELGRGGMGVVYEALDSQLNRKVALKLMLANPSADSKEASLDEERFVQEAQLSAKLKHPNIVTVYEAGLLEGRRFLAMELIEGLAYSDWRKDAAGLKQQVEVLRDVALAVHHAHEQGILHRDLKPRNVLVGAGNRPFVTDFGLAKSLGTAKAHHSLTGSGAVVGTPAYMSPEQAQGNERVDWRTDIWSLGVMLYETLTNRTPFTGESPIEILMKVVKDPVPPPSSVVEGGAALALDRAIETICLKALAKRDRDRYVTARAFAEDLTRWLNGEQVRVSAPRTRKRSRAWAYIVGAAAGVLLVVGATLFLMSSRPSVEADLIQARRFMELENYFDAASAYSGVLKVDPKNAEAIEGVQRARELETAGKKKREENIRINAEVTKAEEEKARAKVEEIRKKAEAAQTEEERERVAREKAEAEFKLQLAEEAKRKADEQYKIQLALKTQNPVVSPAGGVWDTAANLLQLVELPRSVVWGTWSVKDNKLLSGHEGFARVEIPYTPPEEYDARLVFSRLTGAGEVALILPVRGGTSFSVELGGWMNSSNGFQAYKGQRRPGHAASSVSGRALENDRPYTLEVEVRKEWVRAKLDGQAVPAAKVETGDLSLDPCWSLRTPGAFGLGTNGSFTVFQRLDLAVVKGKGTRGALPAPAPLKAVPVAANSLKPGLVGTYFLGSNFEVPAFSQVDAAPAFSWPDGYAWRGGPSAAFSARWTGYLHVPKPKGGTYSFTLSSDDGARLFLDGVQMISNWKVNSETARSPFVMLEEGYHRLEVEYFQETYQAGILLSWTDAAETAPVAVPPRLFHHDPGTFRTLAATRRPELLAVLPAHTNYVTAGAFSPDGKFLATVSEDKKAKLWNVASRREVFSMPGHTQGVLCLAFSPDGKLMATGGLDHRIRLWEPATGLEVKVLDGHAGSIGALAFSPDGKRLASASFDQTVKLWDPVSFKEVRTLLGHAGSVETLSFSPDGGTLASGGLDRTVRIWSLDSGRQERVLAGHADYVQGVAFSPDGKTLASASWDGLIKLWDPQDGREKRILAGHTGEVFSVAFSADGLLLASGGSDGMVRIWDATAGREARVLPGHSARVMGVSFAREGRLLVSASFDMTARLWDLRDR